VNPGNVYCPFSRPDNYFHESLGGANRHFGFNRRWAAFFGFGSLLFGAVGVAALTVMRHDSEWWYSLVGIGFCALNIYGLVRTVIASATICERGVSFKTLRSQGEMLWEDVDKFRYSVLVTYHQGFIKTISYRLQLTDKDGQRAELGSNLEHPKELAEWLLNKLQPLILQKTTTAFESGKELDLGAIKVSREGITISIGLSRVHIPLANVAGCFIDKGMLTICEQVGGKVKDRTVFMRRVDNACALKELVNTRIVQRAAAASATR